VSGNPRVPLGVLDLVPVVSGSDASSALANTVDLAQRAEALGYGRYWFAEHHLNPGVAGTSPALLIALVAELTQRIRLGSGGVQSGHRTALSVVEEFGLLAARHPGRIDLGLGRSGGRDFLTKRLAGLSKEGQRPEGDRPPKPGAYRTDEGLLIPERPSMRHLAGSPRLAATADLLQQPDATTPEYDKLLDDIVGLLEGTYRAANGVPTEPVPGTGADVELWVLGSSAGESAAVAGRRALRFAGNYHVSPATVLEAVDAYREAFVPSEALPRPYVAVSADVVVAEDDDTAAQLASGYGLWVLGIRRGEGARAFPSPAESRAHRWSDEDRALVKDRVDTQFVGGPATVVAQLEQLQAATEADELVVTTVTHDHEARARSFALLAEAWFEGSTASSAAPTVAVSG
jgi:alkanesulfonate monooxygenase SsuD/methylene tetrahydromethanopterin reductase-like flavin-dependent oxidoreductase (luciferase family)